MRNSDHFLVRFFTFFLKEKRQIKIARFLENFRARENDEWELVKRDNERTNRKSPLHCEILTNFLFGFSFHLFPKEIKKILMGNSSFFRNVERRARNSHKAKEIIFKTFKFHI